MISNGTYLMILGVFLILIIIFLLAVFFYLRRTIGCSKSRNMDPASGDKDHEDGGEDGAEKGTQITTSDTNHKINNQGQLQNHTSSGGKHGEQINLLPDYSSSHHNEVNQQESLNECNNCLNCSLIEMGSSCSYSDGSCPQCGRIPP